MKKTGLKVNIAPLKALGQALKDLDDGNYHVQIGIFGDKAARRESVALGAWAVEEGKSRHIAGEKKATSGGLTNAELGFIHEMGSKTRDIPRRSFLLDTFKLMPGTLMEMMKADVLTLFKAGKIPLFLKRVGLAAEILVQKAFDTGGFGRWQPIKRGTIARKGSSAILIDTGQLRNSIASRAVRG